jgi:hypothetical protein
MGVGTTFGALDEFGGPVLFVYDAALLPSPELSFSDVVAGGRKAIMGEWQRHTDASGPIIQRQQSKWGVTYLTSANSTSQAQYPNLYINHDGAGDTGYWQQPLIEDTTSQSYAEAQNALDRFVEVKAFPRDTFEFDTEERVLPGETIGLGYSLEGIADDTVMRVAKVRLNIQAPDTILSHLTVNTRRLGLFDDGSESVYAPPIEGDNIPPLPPDDFTLTSNVCTGDTGYAELTFDITPSPSPDASGYQISGRVNNLPYFQDVEDDLTPTLTLQSGVPYSLQAKAYDNRRNFSPGVPVPPLVGTTAVYIPDAPDNLALDATFGVAGYDYGGVETGKAIGRFTFDSPAIAPDHFQCWVYRGDVHVDTIDNIPVEDACYFLTHQLEVGDEYTYNLYSIGPRGQRSATHEDLDPGPVPALELDPPTITYVSQGHEPTGYYINVSVNHSSLTHIWDGWVKAHSTGRSGTDHLVRLIGGVPIGIGTPGGVLLPRTAKIPGLALGTTYELSAQVMDSRGVWSDFCTPISHTVTGSGIHQPPSPWSDATDEDPFVGWNPISPAVDADFAIARGAGNTFEGQASLSVTLGSGTKAIISPLFNTYPLEKLSLQVSVQRSGSGGTLTGNAYIRYYEEDGTTQVGSDVLFYTTALTTSFVTSPRAVETTPAGAYTYAFILSTTVTGTPLGALVGYWSYPKADRQADKTQIEDGAVDFDILDTGVANAIPGGNTGNGLKVQTQDVVVSVSRTGIILVPNGSLKDDTGGAVELDFDTPSIVPLSASATFSNSTAENTLYSDDLLANRLQYAPQTYNLRAFGRMSNGLSGHTTTIKVKVGNSGGTPVTVFSQSIPTITGANAPWMLDFTMTLRTSGASGTAWAYLVSRFNSTDRTDLTSTSTFAVNTTNPVGIIITEQFSALSASDTITIDQAVIS